MGGDIFKGLNRYDRIVPFYNPIVTNPSLQWSGSGGLEADLTFDGTYTFFRDWQERITPDDRYSANLSVLSPRVQWGNHRLNLDFSFLTPYRFSLDRSIPNDDPTPRLPGSAVLPSLAYLYALDDMPEKPVNEILNARVSILEKYRKLARLLGLSDSGDESTLNRRIEGLIFVFVNGPDFQTFMFSLQNRFEIEARRDLYLIFNEQRKKDDAVDRRKGCRSLAIRFDSLPQYNRLCKPEFEENKRIHDQKEEKINAKLERRKKAIDAFNFNIQVIFEESDNLQEQAKKLVFVELLNFLAIREIATKRKSIGFVAGLFDSEPFLDFGINSEFVDYFVKMFHVGEFADIPYFVSIMFQSVTPNIIDSRVSEGPSEYFSNDLLSTYSARYSVLSGALEFQSGDNKIMPRIIARFLHNRVDHTNLNCVDCEDSVGAPVWLAGGATYHRIMPGLIQTPHTFTLDANLYSSFKASNGFGNEMGGRVTGSFMWNPFYRWTINSALSFVGVKPWGESLSVIAEDSYGVDCNDFEDGEEEVCIGQINEKYRLWPNYRYGGFGVSARSSVSYRAVNLPVLNLDLGLVLGGDYLSENGGLGWFVGGGAIFSAAGALEMDNFWRDIFGSR